MQMAERFDTAFYPGQKKEYVAAAIVHEEYQAPHRNCRNDDGPQPMDLDNIQQCQGCPARPPLTPQEWTQLLQGNRCFYCQK